MPHVMATAIASAVPRQPPWPNLPRIFGPHISMSPELPDAREPRGAQKGRIFRDACSRSISIFGTICIVQGSALVPARAPVQGRTRCHSQAGEADGCCARDSKARRDADVLPPATGSSFPANHDSSAPCDEFIRTRSTRCPRQARNRNRHCAQRVTKRCMLARRRVRRAAFRHSDRCVPPSCRISQACSTRSGAVPHVS